MNFWKHANSNRGAGAEPKLVREKGRFGGLGPNQLAWCRDRIPGFRDASDRMAEMQRQTEVNRVAMTETHKPLEDPHSS